MLYTGLSIKLIKLAEFGQLMTTARMYVLPQYVYYIFMKKTSLICAKYIFVTPMNDILPSVRSWSNCC